MFVHLFPRLHSFSWCSPVSLHHFKPAAAPLGCETRAHPAACAQRVSRHGAHSWPRVHLCMVMWALSLSVAAVIYPFTLTSASAPFPRWGVAARLCEDMSQGSKVPGMKAILTVPICLKMSVCNSGGLVFHQCISETRKSGWQLRTFLCFDFTFF